MEIVKIHNRAIGENEPCFIIAEAGVNHNGDIELAKEMIDKAREAGADAIKFQTFKASSLVTRKADKADYQKDKTGTGSQYDMLKSLELSYDDYGKLKYHSDEQGIIFLSTPYDFLGADILDSLEMPAFKIASGEITNFPLLKHIARKGKTIIISTGMAVMDEIFEALQIIEEEGLKDIIVLHCITSYPAPMEELNLKVLSTMMRELEYPIGYSDHSTGILAPVAAVALGACVVEKHFTLDRTMEGPDHAASLEPDELADMVKAIRDIESALGTGIKEPTATEREIKTKSRKSIVAGRNIPEGTLLTGDMLAIKRPGDGLHPREIEKLIGRKTSRPLEEDQQLTIGDVE